MWKGDVDAVDADSPVKIRLRLFKTSEQRDAVAKIVEEVGVK